MELWCSANRFLEFTSGSHILSLLLCAWIFQTFQIVTKPPETLHKWPNQSLLKKKLTLDYFEHILVLWQTLHDFTYMLSKAFLSGILVDFATHHTASKSFEILHASSNHCLLIRKLSLMELWCTAYRFLEFTSGSHILSILLCAWIFQTFQIVTKPLETLHKWPNKSLLKKKLTLDYLEHILVLWQTLHDFTYMPSKAFLSGILVDLATHHTASRSFEILHASSNHCLLIRKLSLMELWCTAYRFLEFTSPSHILSLLLCAWIFQTFQIVTKPLETLHKWPNKSLLKKKLTFDYLEHILVLWQTLHDFTYVPSKAFLNGILVDFATHHTASKSSEILHAALKNCLLIRKLSLMELWCSANRFLEFTSCSHILSLFLCAWIFQTFQIVTKPPETLHKWPNKSLLKKKLTLDYLEHILVLWQTLHDFTYMPSKAFLSGILVDLATHHTASKSFEILHASSNNCLLIRKLSLMELWCSGNRFLDFTSGFHILSLLLCTWIFQTFQIVTKPPETLHKQPNKSFLKKKLTLDYLEHILVLWQTVHDFTYMPSKAFLSGILVDFPTDLTASKSSEILHAASNNCLLIRKLSLMELWCSANRFLEFTSGSHILSLLLCAWIFQTFQIVTKPLETLHNWPNQSLLKKKLTLDYLEHILVLWQTLHDFTYMPSKAFLSGIYVDLATRHTASKSFEIFACIVE